MEVFIKLQRYIIISLFVFFLFSSCIRTSYWTNIDGMQEKEDERINAGDNDLKQWDDLFITTQQNIETLQIFVDSLNKAEHRNGENKLSISSHLWPVYQFPIGIDSYSIPFIRAIPFQNKGYAVLPAYQTIQDRTHDILFYTDTMNIDEGHVHFVILKTCRDIIKSMPEGSDNWSIDHELQVLSVLSDSMNWNLNINMQ